ncbi:hypothetical protein MUP77_03715 [Candidatus Bathyarchaeota archaeon]|nr:hypothetical protein [Candidatus Bathyarchaeota archaeon]
MRFWKKIETRNQPNPHVELDAKIKEIPELEHDIILGLLRDSKKWSDEPFLMLKYKFTHLLLREYIDFMIQEGLTQVFLRRDGRIEDVAVTEKGKLFIKYSETKRGMRSTEASLVQSRSGSE